LVLGGGGPVGIAWESGILSGLAAEGVQLADAEFILGTSAGAFVGSQLRMGRKAESLAAAQLSAARPDTVGATPGLAANLVMLMELMTETASSEGPAEDVRRKIGVFALEARTMSEKDFIASFGGMLKDLESNAWPDRAYACTAVDAETGGFVVWTGDMGVGLARAVASSCSVPGVYPPITIKGRRYIDGGMRSATNADIVIGFDRVVVVSVTMGGGDAMAERSQRQLATEVATIRGAGGDVELIQPDAESLIAFGTNLMDDSRRPVIAEAGIKQGRAEAARLRGFWND
jgi:NTE family protein